MHARMPGMQLDTPVAVASSEARVAPVRSSRNLEWLDAQLDAHHAEEHAQLAAEARRACPTLALADAARISECCLWASRHGRKSSGDVGCHNQGSSAKEGRAGGHAIVTYRAGRSAMCWTVQHSLS